MRSQNTFRVRFTNGETMDSKNTPSLNIPEFIEAASVAHAFTDMASNSLISVGQMGNEGYYITFMIGGVTLYNYAGKAALKGQRDLNTGLWRINLRPDKVKPTIAAANNI
jgi:hypothetical protein